MLKMVRLGWVTCCQWYKQDKILKTKTKTDFWSQTPVLS